MRKLQQLLFLGPVEGRLGGQEDGGTGVRQVGRESESGSLLQAAVFLGGWRRRVPRGPMEPGGSEQEGQVVTGDRVRAALQPGWELLPDSP